MSLSQEEREVYNRYPYPSSLVDKYGGGSGDKHSQQGALVATYDVAEDGGVVGSIIPKLTITLPDNAIVTKTYLDIVTAFTSTGGTGTIAVTIQSTADALAAVDADTLSDQAAGIQDGAVANMLKLTAERTLQIEVGTAAMLTGKALIYVEWVQSE